MTARDLDFHVKVFGSFGTFGFTKDNIWSLPKTRNSYQSDQILLRS